MQTGHHHTQEGSKVYTMEALNTETMQGRQLDGLLRSTNRKARMLLTVEITGTRHYQQTFRAKAWTTREGTRMLTLDLNDGDWAQGTYATKVLHVDATGGTLRPARGMNDNLLLYAATAAVRWAWRGAAPQPSNGTVAVTASMHCGACGMELTHPVSKELGIGPECAKRLGYEHHYKGATLTSARRRQVQAAQARQVPAATPHTDDEIVAPCSHCRGAAAHSGYPCGSCKGTGTEVLVLAGMGATARASLTSVAATARNLAGRMAMAGDEGRYVQLAEQLDTALGALYGDYAEERGHLAVAATA